MISRNVATALLLPECRIGRGHYFSITAPMHVPEAAMHENCLPRLRYYNVGFPRQRFSMKAVANAKPAKQCTHGHFRFCVLASNRGHAPTALLTRENIRHANFFLTKLTNSSTPSSLMPERGYCL